MTAAAPSNPRDMDEARSREARSSEPRSWFIVPERGEQLVWSREYGWTFGNGEYFTAAERDAVELPGGGRWAELSPAKEHDRSSSFEDRAAAAADDAMAQHDAALRLEGGADASTRLWHMLASLRAFARREGVDFDATLAELKQDEERVAAYDAQNPSYVIASKTDPELCWSNAYGWTEDNYDTFTQSEHDRLNLPIDGEWEQVDWRKEPEPGPAP